MGKTFIFQLIIIISFIYYRLKKYFFYNSYWNIYISYNLLPYDQIPKVFALVSVCLCTMCHFVDEHLLLNLVKCKQPFNIHQLMLHSKMPYNHKFNSANFHSIERFFRCAKAYL